MRPNAHLWIRPDAYRFMPPGAPRYLGKEAVRYFWPDSDNDRPPPTPASTIEQDLAAEREALVRLRSELAALKAEIRFRELLRKAGFNPDQPREPAGNPDGGQWTREGGDSARVRLATADKPSLGQRTLLALVMELAGNLIQAYRSENGLWDLFGRKSGTVTFALVDGDQIFGSNSDSPTYSAMDRMAADSLRANLIAKYPDVFDVEEIGRMPNNALYHAESTILIRAARRTGGSLAGRTLEVFSDNSMCNNCKTVLPYVGLELGNPTVTFVGPKREVDTMRDGAWLSRER